MHPIDPKTRAALSAAMREVKPGDGMKPIRQHETVVAYCQQMGIPLPTPAADPMAEQPAVAEYRARHGL
jgi:hypothetical protein